MSVFDHVYYPFHHDHINTPHKQPLITPFELQMVGGGVSHENWGVITPLGGLDKSLIPGISIFFKTFVFNFILLLHTVCE